MEDWTAVCWSNKNVYTQILDLLGMNKLSTKMLGVVGHGSNGKKLGLSCDPLTSIPTLAKLSKFEASLSKFKVDMPILAK